MPWHEGLDPTSPVYEIASCTNKRLRVVAGPGTGKSFAMKRRVARLLESGVDAQKILPVTFTRVAAEDLHRELVGMGVQGCEQIKGRTLHSLAFQILMSAHAFQSTGRVARPLNDFEIQPFLADLAGRHGGTRKLKERIKAFEAAWARLQSDEPGYVKSEADKELEDDLIEWLKFHHSMLIGEAIPLVYHYLKDNPVAPICSKFSHILVDEFQDLNKAEQGVVNLLAASTNICIVGDDDQSIYRFKHAHPDGIRQWLEVNPGATDLELLECRRCPTQVVEMANALIANNQDRPLPRALSPRSQNGPGKVAIRQYATIEDEVRGIADIIQQLTKGGTLPGDILVLAQRSVIGTPIYKELVAREVPARSYYAESELDIEEAQKPFALLKLHINREDRVALRWLLGIDSNDWRTRAYQKLRTHCETTGISPWKALEQLANGAIQIPYTRALVQRFNAIRDDLVRLDKLPGLGAVIDDLLPDGEDAVRDLRTLALQTLEAVDDDRDTFLSELTTSIAKPEVPNKVTDVRIMSLHKSKGLSSPVTIIAGCVQGLLPRLPNGDSSSAEYRAQMEEQRRLFYVGITRVKAVPEEHKPGKLVLTYSQKMSLADAMKAGIQPAYRRQRIATLNASQFIQELGSVAPPSTRG